MSSRSRRRACLLLVVAAWLVAATATAAPRDVVYDALDTHGDRLVAVGTDRDDPEATVVVAGRFPRLVSHRLPGLGPQPDTVAGAHTFLVLSARGDVAWQSTDGARWSPSPVAPAGVTQVVAWADSFVALRGETCELLRLDPSGWAPIGSVTGATLPCTGAAARDGRLAIASRTSVVESADLQHWRPWTHPSGHRLVAPLRGGGALVASFRDDECSPSAPTVALSRDGSSWLVGALSPRSAYATSGACQGARCVVATRDGVCDLRDGSWSCRPLAIRTVAPLSRGFVGAGDGLFFSFDGRGFQRLFVPSPR